MNEEEDATYFTADQIFKSVPEDNPYMREAREFARLHSLDKTMPNASIIVKDGKVIGRGANGSNYHDTHICERIKNKIPTGQGYELCEGCHPKNHGESRAVKDAQDHGFDARGADLYMWGHWWCCRWCWKMMIDAGIKNIFVLENSQQLFNKSHPNNIVGKQFEV